jgi:small subunit ribosomal protein S3
LGEDELIRNAIFRDVGHAGIARIEIERAAQNITVTIHTAKPGVVIGRGGEAIKALRVEMDRQIGGTVSVNVQEVPNANISGPLVAQRISEQLMRRFAFRRVMKQAVQRTMESGALGVKVRCAGRLGGTEQARAEWYSEGRVPLQTLRANIDYGTAEAKTNYGIVGIKAWVFHGEIVGDRARKAAVLPRERRDDPRRRRPQARRRGRQTDRPSGRENK